MLLTNSVYYAPVYNDGSLGIWGTGTSYPSAVSLHSCSIYNNYAYCVGGNTISGPTATTESATALSSGVGSWSSGSAYSNAVRGQSCSTYYDYLFCVGGNTISGASNSVYYSIISAGGFGAWKPTAVYPIKVSRSSCQTYYGYLYCVGGTLSNGANTSNTYYSQIRAGGLGAWQTTNSYPTTVSGQSCATYGGYIYCVGGPGTNAVYYATVSSGGIGTWTATKSYPTTKINQESCVAVSNGYLYCVGGWTGSSDTNSVYYSQFLTPGLGNWNTNHNTNYPKPIYRSSVAAPPINIAPPLSISLSPLSATIYVGQNVMFTNITTGGVPPYLFAYSTNAISYSISGNSITFTAAGTFNVVESVTDSNSIVDTAHSQTAVITVIPVPTTTTTSTSTSTSTTSIYTTSTSVTTIYTTTTSITYEYTTLPTGFGYAYANFQYAIEQFCGNPCYSPTYTSYFSIYGSVSSSCGSNGVWILVDAEYPFCGGFATGASCYATASGGTVTCTCSGYQTLTTSPYETTSYPGYPASIEAEGECYWRSG